MTLNKIDTINPVKKTKISENNAFEMPDEIEYNNQYHHTLGRCMNIILLNKFVYRKLFLAEQINFIQNRKLYKSFYIVRFYIKLL